MSARAPAEQMAMIALTLMSESGQPVGARRLGEVFRSNGIEVAEATAGRYLNELDEAGFTRARGRQGRTLTTAGRNHLVQLRLREQLAEASSLIAAAAEITRGESIVDLLHARRAVEPEAARLAASRATCEEIDGMEKEADLCACSDGAARIQHSRAFHHLIAAASHNRMLEAVSGLLLEINGRPEDKLELHRRSDSSGAYAALSRDHQDIVRALRDRDALEAERLMRAHLDRIIAIARPAPRAPIPKATGGEVAC